VRILICEDNAVIAMALEALVEDLGHEVAGVAASSETALAAAGRPDLALVDLGLADGWTGRQLVEKLTARAVPTIVLSGQPEDVGPGGPVLGVLRKPVDYETLARLIDGFSRRRAQGPLPSVERSGS